MRKITVIPATLDVNTQKELTKFKKKKVCAYARVSTDTDEQATSYDAQISYYKRYIKDKPEWDFVDIYTDEGISGTSTKNRAGFNKMIEDALSGKIDLIITKSLSRFARNTVDTLVTIRKLKEKGVECYFEKENIYTFDSKCELVLTIMSSLAQEESRSISQNVKWGKRESFKKGKITIPFKSFLGFERGSDGSIKINKEEAEVVKRIYKEFLQGWSVKNIADNLTKDGIRTPANKDIWYAQTIKSILTNEKYKGDAILQKSFVVNYLTHESRKNNGEIPKYYVENSHPFIISPVEWEIVQLEYKKRGNLKTLYNTKNIFNSKLICADCNGSYGRKIWHSTDAYRTARYRCNLKYKNKCTTATLKEEQVKEGFVKAYNLLINDKNEIVDNLKELIMIVDKKDKILKNIESLQEKIEQVVSQSDELISKIDDSNYNEKYNELSQRYNKLQDELSREQDNLSNNDRKIKSIQLFIDLIKDKELINEYDSYEFNLLTDNVKVDGNKIIYIFRGGEQIEIPLEK